MLKLFNAIFKRPSKNPPDTDGMMNIFRKKYGEFKILLESNAELLKIISGLEEKLSGQHVFGMSFIRSESVRTIFHCARMIRSFEALSGSAYPELMQLLNSIQSAINQELELKNIPRVMDLVLPYSAITREMVDYIGGKNANLGEMKSRIQLPIPKGFAITTTAFDEFIEFNDLMDEIRKQKMELDVKSPKSIMQVSEKIQSLFRNAQVPPALEKAVLDAYDKEISPDRSIKVAIRSSAIGEDSELSFAGQYQSFLNVSREDIIPKYKEVLASLFTPRAISYRLHMGINFEDAAMSVACLEMINAKSAGVIYSRHPYDTQRNNILINATWGLGAYVVDGTVSPDSYELSKGSPPQIIEKRISAKIKKLIIHPAGGLSESEVGPDMRNAASISDGQAVLLAQYAMKLESHYQSPQDIEWAVDDDGKVLILQARLLKVEGKKEAFFSTKRFDEYPLLIKKGDVASPGVGYGQAHIIHSEKDLLAFPEGGVLVAAHSSPQYAIVMGKAQAIVANAGSITGHMASLAREFKVPTLLNTHNATMVIADGMPITVDAFSGRVYSGRVDELLNIKWERGSFMKETPVYHTLQKLAQFIVPLNLVNPKSTTFAPKYCRTIHDIMRLIHELSYSQIFQISDFTTDHGRIAVKLDAVLPIDLYVIDLGGGLAPVKNKSSISFDQVLSTPLKAVLNGMLHKDLKPSEPRPVNLGGFLSVMRQQMLAPPNIEVERFGDKSYAIISDKYLNFSSRVGYHYSILDCYCDQVSMKNYITFQFKGGAADNVRRNRRARLIQNVLEANGFLVEVQADQVSARFVKHAPEMTIEKLDMLGKLLIYSRQMDMLMSSEQSIAQFTNHFLSGNFRI